MHLFTRIQIFQYLLHHKCLSHSRRGGIYLNLLLPNRNCPPFYGVERRVFPCKAAYYFRCTVLPVCKHCTVEIPVEITFPGIPQILHNPPLASVGSIEPYEHHPLRKLSILHRFCNLPVYLPLISNPFSLKSLLEVSVEGIHQPPD